VNGRTWDEMLRAGFVSSLAVEDVLTRGFADERPDEVECLRQFTKLMLNELANNARKGNRPGWREMTPQQAVAEVFWHASKAAVTARELSTGHVFAERRRDQIADPFGRPSALREYCADVGTCALMLLDVMHELMPEERST
jgi:hypothetical protein